MFVVSFDNFTYLTLLINRPVNKEVELVAQVQNLDHNFLFEANYFVFSLKVH